MSLGRFASERGAVLADHADRGALHALAAARGWTRILARPAGFTEMEQEIWEADGDHRILYVESPWHGTRVVAVAGPEAGPVEETFAAVTAVLPVVPVDDVLAGLLADPLPGPRELIRGLNRLMAAHLVALENGERPPEDPRYRRVVERLAGHPERQVRRAVLFTVGDLAALRPELAGPVLARRGEETELGDLVDVFAEVVESRG